MVNNAFTDQGSGSGSRSGMFRLLHAKNVARPQLKFKEKVDNSNTPFIPKIFIKPNAIKPLPPCKKYFSCSSICCFCYIYLTYTLTSLTFVTYLLSCSSLIDFTNKQIRKERPEDIDVPAALADFIHQQRTQEHVEDM